MARRKTQKEYIDEVKSISPYIIVSEEYIDNRTPILHLCTIHNIYWKPTPSSVLRGSGCPACANTKSRQKQVMTPQEYIDKLKIRNPFVTPIEDYIDAHTAIKHFHAACGHITEMQPSSALRGSGCIFCKGKKIHNAFAKSQKDFEHELSLVNPDIKVTGEYTSANKSIECKCTKCGKKWKARAAHLLDGHGCPSCNEPIGERQIRTYLEKHKIVYERNKTFDSLIGVGGQFLSYDYFLPTYNLIIEFQGEQHERPIQFFGGKKAFEIQQEHDKRKKNYALTNGYRFLEIFYKDISHIDFILSDYLNTLKLETVTTTGTA